MVLWDAVLPGDGLHSSEAMPLAAAFTGDSQHAGGGGSSTAPSLWARWAAFQTPPHRDTGRVLRAKLIQLLRDLIFTVIQSKPVSTELAFIECGDPDKYQRMKQIPSPRILATHLNDCLHKSIFKNKAKIIVLFRNPKDTAVSFFHFHNNVPSIPSYSSWDEFLSEFMNGKAGWGSYFDHAVTWNKQIEDDNTMIIIYEDLKENLTASVNKQIAVFFGFSPGAEQIQSIADRATFQAVRDKVQKTHGVVGSIIFHKGVAGDWKNLFAEAQNQEMDTKCKVCLEGTKLGAKLKYDVYCKA
ncbi:LOW QUALITY PROTEIN: sulfotransferase 6B1 [Pterocles gutturalis]